MIPLPFPRIYLYAGLAVACIGVFLYIRFLQARVDHWKEENAKSVATLITERAQHKQAEEDMEARRLRDLEEASKLREQTNAHLLARIQHHADSADALRVRLAAAGRVRPLAPAASAPADCRNYESDPTRLSDAHREFLIGEAAAAERNGDLLEACRADYQAVMVACGVK